MNRPKIKALFSPKTCSGTSGGFTFIEILVSLALLATLGLVIWSGLLNAQNLISRAGGAVTSTAKILQLDNALRKTMGRIRVPFWVSDSGAAMMDGRLVIFWLDGDPENALVLENRGGRIIVRFSKSADSVSFGPYEGVALLLHEGTGGAPDLVEIKIGEARGPEDPVKLVYRFGVSPFPFWEGP